MTAFSWFMEARKWGLYLHVGDLLAQVGLGTWDSGPRVNWPIEHTIALWQLRPLYG